MNSQLRRVVGRLIAGAFVAWVVGTTPTAARAGGAIRHETNVKIRATPVRTTDPPSSGAHATRGKLSLVRNPGAPTAKPGSLEEASTRRRAAERDADHDKWASAQRVNDPLARYMAEIRRFPTPSADESKLLSIRLLEQGDVDAGHRLYTGHLGHVVKVVQGCLKKFSRDRRAQNLMDLIQEGNIALLKAMPKYDPYRGPTFKFYSRYKITAAFYKYLVRNWSDVRVGTNQEADKFFGLGRRAHQMLQDGAHPEPELLAPLVKLSPEAIARMLPRLFRDVRLDAPIDNLSDTPRAEFLADTSRPYPEGLVVELDLMEKTNRAKKAFIRRLTGRARQVFRHRILPSEPTATLEAIGDAHGVSKEAIRQQESPMRERFEQYLKARLTDPVSFPH